MTITRNTERWWLWYAHRRTWSIDCKDGSWRLLFPVPEYFMMCLCIPPMQSWQCSSTFGVEDGSCFGWQCAESEVEAAAGTIIRTWIVTCAYCVIRSTAEPHWLAYQTPVNPRQPLWVTLDIEAGATELSLVLTGRVNIIIFGLMLPLGMHYVLLLDQTSRPKQFI